MAPNSLASSPRRLVAFLLVLTGLCAQGVAQQKTGEAAPPANLAVDLQRLLLHRQMDSASLQALSASQVDAAGRVRVTVKLSGSVSPRDVREALARAGCAVDELPTAVPAGWSIDSLAASIPVDSLASLAAMPGVQSIVPIRPARRRSPPASAQAAFGAPQRENGPRPYTPPVGHAPSQASGPLGVSAVAAQYTGAGVTIGVVSNSFNACTTQCTGSPATDIASGNLPGPNNPYGDTSPVVVVSESASPASDDGRALLQIIYGMAPKAKLCFATIGDAEISMASAILALADPNGSCKANVIMDDVSFYEEPFFSDGVISGAIDQVTAAGVTYVTSSANSGVGLFDGTFNPITDAAARAGNFGNLKLSQVPAALTAGGFQNFSTSTTGSPQLSFVFNNADGTELEMQWDDPFVANKVTTDYNLLVFDANGTYLAGLSGIDSNLATGEPFELTNIQRLLGTYQIAISRATLSSTPAQHLRIIQTDSDGVASGLPPQVIPTVFGHAGAAGAISASAFYFKNLSTPESYVSTGPFINYFDAAGNRLNPPQTRLRPLVSGVDGIDLTFPLGGGLIDRDGDGFNDFFGTSASAAAVTAVAALTLQASGMSGKPAQIASWLAQSGSSPTVWSSAAGYGYVNAQKATLLASGGILGTTPSSIAVSASQNPAVIGATVTFTAIVTASGATPVGNVQFFDGGASLGATQLDATGKATLVTSALTTGTHNITALYDGDAYHLGSASANYPQTMTGTPMVTATSLTTSTSPASVFSTVVLTATVGSTGSVPTGSVTFYSGNTVFATRTLDSNGVATFSSSIIGIGTYSITAGYSGDGTHLPSTSAILTQVVGGKSATYVLQTGGSPYAYGQQFSAPLYLNATVNSSDTKDSSLAGTTVTFYDGSNAIGSCILSTYQTLTPASCATNATAILSVGSHNLTFKFPGDGDTAAGISVPVVQIITPATVSPVLTVTSSQNPSPAGAPVAITVAIGGAAPVATGTVTFSGFTGGPTVVALNNGVAAITLSNLPQSAKSVYIAYSGDDTYLPANQTFTQNTSPPSSTTITLTTSLTPAAPAAAVTFTATMTPAPTASFTEIVFLDGNVPLGNVSISTSGVASLTTSSLSSGTHTIRAVYQDDSAPSISVSSAPLTEVISGTGAVSSVSLTTATNPAASNGSATFTAHVTSAGATPTGTVTFFVDGVLYNQNTLNAGGSTSLPISFTSAGTHSVTAHYSGDAQTAPSDSPAFSEAVNLRATTLSLTAYPNPVVFGFGTSLHVSISPAGTGSVTFFDNGTALVTAQGISSSASFTATGLAIGSHSITASYSGDSLFAASTSSAVMLVVKAAVAPATPVITWLPVTTPVYAGQPLGGAVLSASTTVAGTFTFTATAAGASPVAITPTNTLPAGTYTLSATFTPKDTASYTSASASISLTVVAQHVWIVNSDGSLTGLDGSGTPVSTSGTSGGGVALATGTGGTLWSLGSSGNSLTQFGSNGAPAATFNGGGLSNATALAVDGNGVVWVANSNGSVSQFTGSGAAVSGAGGYSGGGLNAPTGVAIDISGNVWISNSGNNSLTQILGAAAPAAPLANAVQNRTPGVKP